MIAKGDRTLHKFAQVFGLGLALISLGVTCGLGGVFGLGQVLGLSSLIVPNEGVRLANNILYLLTGITFLFLGFRRDIDYKLRRDLITGIGALYLLSSVFSVGGMLLFGLSLDLYSSGYDLERMVIGLSCVLVAYFSSRGSSSPGEYITEGEARPTSGNVVLSAKENDPHNQEDDYQHHRGANTQDDHFH